MKRRVPQIFLLVIFIFANSACNRSRLNASACAEPGTIGSDRVSNPTQGFDISFQYYLPPCYEKQINARFPVLYLITMPFESNLSPTDNTPMSLADRLIHTHKMPPVIIIVPADTVAQGYHAAVAVDLIPYVDEKYRTIQDRLYRGVGGISHGGLAAGEKETVNEWIASSTNQPRIRIDVGEQDGILPITQNLTSVLDQHKVRYELNIGQGSHNWAFWSRLIESYLLWFAEAWK